MAMSRIAVCIVICSILSTLAGCGQAPTMNVELSNDTSSSSPVRTKPASPTPDTGKSKEIAATFLDEFQFIRETCDERFKSHHKNIREQMLDPLMSLDEKQQIIANVNEDFRADCTPQLQKAIELTSAHATEEAAIEPLIWLATMADKTDIAQYAATLLIEHHLIHPKVIKATRNYREVGYAWVERILREQIVSRDLPEDQRPVQMFTLARNLFLSVEYRHGDASKLDESIQLYSALAQNYANTVYRQGLTLGELATAGLNEAKNLTVGKPAPEIDGKDLYGVPFKLSDYRGKVVMLSFWASWCGPCMALVPHERELVKRYEGRPFALIGVNGDTEKDQIVSLCEKEEISWRSFSCDEKGPNGPIPRQWNVAAWPTVILIDHTGVIKSKWADDTVLAKLVAEAEKSEN